LIKKNINFSLSIFSTNIFKKKSKNLHLKKYFLPLIYIMKPISEKNIKPLKKLKSLKKQKEDTEKLVKPAIRIQELKNKLIILGHELFATKKINQSLYRKLQLITYSRTTEQKLKDSYKTLKDIDNNIKQSDASQDKQKGAPKPKKITVKAFTENKKIVDEDSSILYNIYLKYKIWFIINDKLKNQIVNYL
jgi:DNA topoisomerase IA